MLARVLLTAFSFVACVSAVHAQLPPDSVILSKVKISEKQKSVDLWVAIRRGIKKTEEGTPALLEFITSKETEYSTF